jgi:PII-like signaling protein
MALALGEAKKVTIHLNEDTSSAEDFLYREIFAFLFERGVAGATLLRPEAGFGSHHQRHLQHGDAIEGQHLPVRIEFIESVERVDALLPELCALVTDGLIEAHDTVIVRSQVASAPR